MTWELQFTSLSAPLVGFPDAPIAWPGPFRPPVKTNDPAALAAWVSYTERVFTSEYLASGGGAQRRIEGEVALGIFVEPPSAVSASGAPVNTADAEKKLRQLADALETRYHAGSNPGSLYFHVALARLEEETSLLPDEFNSEWAFRELTIPFERYEDIGDTEEAFLPGTSSNQKRITQASHGFALGDWLGFNGSAWVKAQATSGGVRARGVVSRVVDTNIFELTTGDVVHLPAHGLAAGDIFLSTATAGAGTSTGPAPGELSQELGAAIDANFVIVQIGAME